MTHSYEIHDYSYTHAHIRFIDQRKNHSHRTCWICLWIVQNGRICIHFLLGFLSFFFKKKTSSSSNAISRATISEEKVRQFRSCFLLLAKYGQPQQSVNPKKKKGEPRSAPVRVEEKILKWEEVTGRTESHYHLLNWKNNLISGGAIIFK